MICAPHTRDREAAARVSAALVLGVERAALAPSVRSIPPSPQVMPRDPGRSPLRRLPVGRDSASNLQNGAG
jgi:hypothetical protein